MKGRKKKRQNKSKDTLTISKAVHRSTLAFASLAVITAVHTLLTIFYKFFGERPVPFLIPEKVLLSQASKAKTKPIIGNTRGVSNDRLT